MLEEFLDYLRYELNRAFLTVEAYRTDIEQFQHWITPSDEENIDFRNVKSNDIRAWMASLAKKGDSPRTLRRKVISLRTFYKWMMKTGKLKKSPVKDIVLPKLSKPLPDIVKPQSIESALAGLALEEENNEKKVLHSLIVEMLYTTGIRRAELVGLNDSDISESKAEIKVTGKRNKQRVIPVTQQLLVKIKKWQEIRDEVPYGEGDEIPLFIVNGKRISPQKVYQIVRDVLKDSPARKKSPHALRHSFASGMLNGGAEIDSVKEFLGHASLATTQIYTHISFSEIKKAYNMAHPRSDKHKN